MPQPGHVRPGVLSEPPAQPPTSRRGRTRPDRLRLIDRWLLHALGGRDGRLHAVDLGYGDLPGTTVSLHRALQAEGVDVQTTGVEREPPRVRGAAAFAEPALRFVQGDFALSGLPGPTPSLVRAMNVLRAYPLAQVRAAQRQLGASLAEGGLLVEGTTDTEGHVACAHLWRRAGRALRYEGLLLCCDGARGFSPWLLRDYLPRDLRRHVRAPEPVHGLLADWADCWQRTRTADPGRSFAGSLRALAQVREDVEFDEALAPQGIARWRPPRPSPRPEVFDGTLTPRP